MPIADDIDILLGKFLKNPADLSVTPIFQLCNIFV